MVEENFGVENLPGNQDKLELIDHLESEMICLEAFYHGKTSGADIKAILRGGLNLIFPDKVEIIDFGTIDCFFLLINTGIEGSTKEAVALFNKTLSAKPEAHNLLLEEMNSLTLEIKEFLLKPNFS